jgi:hypothetical protein
VRADRALRKATVLAIRPERLELYDLDEHVPDGSTGLRGKVVRRMYYGDVYYYDVDVGLGSRSR